MAVTTKGRQFDLTGSVNLAKAAAGGAQGAAKAAGGNRRIRRAGVRPCRSLGLALLCLAAAGHSVAQVEYRCFGEAAPAAKPMGPASVALAYRGLYASFSKWQDGRVPVTIDHRGAPEGYAKADYEKLLSSVLEEVEGVADLTFEYRAVPGDGDGALDAAFENFPGIRFVWEDTSRFGGQAATHTTPSRFLYLDHLSEDEVRDAIDKKNAYEDGMRLELGYIPIAWVRITISAPIFTGYLERDPRVARYLIVHELLHGLGLGHSDNPLSIMHGGPYRHDRGGFHTDDTAGLQALYGLPDELAAGEVDLESAPAGVGLDAANSGFIFQTWVLSTAHVPLNRVGSSSALFHWLNGAFFTAFDRGRPRLELDVCVTGLPAGSPAAIVVYQTSPRGEVFRYLDSDEEFSTESPPWQCAAGTALRLRLSHYDYYAEQPGAWKFAIGVNGGLLSDIVVDIDVAYRPRYEPTSRGSLAVTRRGDGIFDLEARFADGGGPDGIGFGHDWHIPGYEAYDPRYGPPAEELRVQGFTYIPRGGLSVRVELAGPGVYEVFAAADKTRRYDNEGYGVAALARGYLAVPRESGVPSLFGEDGFLHVPAVDVSGSALATALGQVGADVSGGHVELLLKRTGHAGEQYKLVEARVAAELAKATASVSASGQLALGDVAGAGGMRRSMALTPVPDSNPLRFATGTPGTSMTGGSPPPPATSPVPPLPGSEETGTVRLSLPAKWPAGKVVPVAYVHGYELANFSEAEIKEGFFLPALRIIEGAAGVTFRVVDHDPEDGPFAGILISLFSSEDLVRWQDTNYSEPALESYFGRALEFRRHPNRVSTWGERDPGLGIREIWAASIDIHGETANGEATGGNKETNGEAGDAWDRRQWLRAFVKQVIRALGVTVPWSDFAPPYLPEPGEIEALQTLYGPPDVPVHHAEVFNPLDFGATAGDVGLSVIAGDGNDRVRFLDPGNHEFEADDDGKFMIETWRLGYGGTLEVRFGVSFSTGVRDPAGNESAFIDDQDFRAWLVDPSGNIRRVIGDRRDYSGVNKNFTSPYGGCHQTDEGIIGDCAKMTISGKLIIGDILSAWPGTWRMILTGRGAMLYETELEADTSLRPDVKFNKPPEVELSLDALGGGRFRLGMGAEDPEGDPFLLGWAGPGREPEIRVDLNRTWRENLPEPVMLDYTEWDPGIYQVFAGMEGGGQRELFANWRSAYIAVPRRPGVASYFPGEGMLHLPAVQTGDGVREWNLRRVGGDGEGDVRFMLLDSKRVEGGGVTAIAPDPQTGLFHLGNLLGFGRGCGAARLREIPDSDPPRLRLTACQETSNRAPAVANPIAGQEARAGSRFTFTVPDGTFLDPEGDDLVYRYLPPPDAAWLEFDRATRTLSGRPPITAVGKDFSVTVSAHDGYDDSARATFTLAVEARGEAPRLILPDQRVRAGSPFVYTLPDGSFADTDEDTLSYLHSVSPAAEWLAFDASAGTLSGTPPMTAAGKDFSVTVSEYDSYGESARATFTLAIMPAAGAPIAVWPALKLEATAYAGVPFRYVVPGNVFREGDLGELEYTVVVAGDGALPDWLGFDMATGALVGTPGATDVSITPVALILRATNAAGAAMAPLSVTVAERPMSGMLTIAGDDDMATLSLPYVTVLPVAAGGVPACLELTLTAPAANLSVWDFEPDERDAGCDLPTGIANLPLLDGARSLDVPLATFTPAGGRATCLALQFQYNGMFRLTGWAAVNCPAP